MSSKSQQVIGIIPVSCFTMRPNSFCTEVFIQVQKHKATTRTCSGNTWHTNIFIHAAGWEKMVDPHKMKTIFWKICSPSVGFLHVVPPCLCRVTDTGNLESSNSPLHTHTKQNTNYVFRLALHCCP